MTYCRYCDEEIYFDDEFVSESGKKIPIDMGSREPHACSFREPEIIQRYNCDEEIWFDQSKRSKSGKLIPQDQDGNHDCANSVRRFKPNK